MQVIKRDVHVDLLPWLYNVGRKEEQNRVARLCVLDDLDLKGVFAVCTCSTKQCSAS